MPRRTTQASWDKHKALGYSVPITRAKMVKFAEEYAEELERNRAGALTVEREETKGAEEPAITATGLDKLAEESQRCGATRYAEAYRLVACRLRELAKDGVL